MVTNGREQGYIGNVVKVIKEMNQVIVSGANIVSDNHNVGPLLKGLPIETSET